MIQHTFNIMYKEAMPAYYQLICPAIVLKGAGFDEISVLILRPLPGCGETNKNHKVQSNSIRKTRVQSNVEYFNNLVVTADHCYYN
jgi:hypothetical protein